MQFYYLPCLGHVESLKLVTATEKERLRLSGESCMDLT